MTAARIGLVGCGRLAEAGYLPALARVTGARLVAVGDVDEARRDHVARLAHGAGTGPIATFADAASLLDGAEIDGLVLATPAASHLDDATEAAARGVATLVEKPPAPDAAGAAALAALTPAPWVAFNRRFDPGTVAARAAVPAAGPVELRVDIRYRRRSWGALGVHDDAIGDLGPHLVDWVRWLTGSQVVEVRSARLTPQRADVELRLERGRALLHAATDRPHHELIEISDGTGAVVARHRRGGVVACVRGKVRPGPHPLVASLAGQLQAFTRVLAGARSPVLGTAADGCAVMAVVDAARACAKAGHPITVPDPTER